MKTYFTLGLFLFLAHASFCQFLPADCGTPQGQAVLDINNARVGLVNAGDFFWDGVGLPRYAIPKTNGIRRHSIFAGALWIGGYDSTDNQLVTLSQTYRQGQFAYWAGPISPTGTSTKSEVCNAWDRHFSVRKSNIDSFLVAWQPGIQPSAIPLSILTWPGKNNPHLPNVVEGFNDPEINLNLELAPFVDANADGNYNPVDGDYPKILGDQSVWWVMNDIGNVKRYPRPPQVKNFGIEIQVEAYALSNPCVTFIDNNTFYRFKLINKSNKYLNRTHFGFWMDVDLGNFSDDYVGSDVMRGLGYCYNADDFDENIFGYGDTIPAIGIDFLDGVLADANDGIDNNRNGVLDEPAETIPMSNFVYYNNNNNPKNGNPQNGIEYNNFLRSLWRDGSAIAFGTFEGTSAVPPAPWGKFMWPGNSDPYGFSIGGSMQNPTPLPSNWTEFTVPNQPGDRRFVASMGSFTWAPGQVQEFTMAVVWARSDSVGAMPSLRKLLVEDDSVQNWFDRGMPRIPCVAVQNKKLTDILPLRIIPNPNEGIFMLTSNQPGLKRLRILDVNGKAMFAKESLLDNIKLENMNLKTGLYLMEVQSDNHRQTVRFQVR